jgi:hypothetical protein
MQRTAVTALAAVGVAAASLGVPSANAATLEQLINNNLTFTLEDNSAEDLGVDQNNNGLLDVGDTLRGVFAFESFVAMPSGAAFPLNGTDNSAVHGLFEIEVRDKNQVSAGSFTFGFQPHAGFESVYGPGAMVALYESNTALNPFACGTKDACEAGATNGDLRLVLGFAEGKENIWGAGPAPDDIEAARDIAFAANIGQYGARINVLESNLAVPPFIDLTYGSFIAGEFVNFPAEVILSGQILGSGGIDSEYPTFDDADIQMAVVPIPAALPLFLASLGALGMIGRRRNAT